MGKVTVMGSFIYDVTAYVPRYPVDGETVLGYEIKTGPGGKGANQATAAAKCGARDAGRQKGRRGHDYDRQDG